MLKSNNDTQSPATNVKEMEPPQVIPIGQSRQALDDDTCIMDQSMTNGMPSEESTKEIGECKPEQLIETPCQPILLPETNESSKDQLIPQPMDSITTANPTEIPATRTVPQALKEILAEALEEMLERDTQMDQPNETTLKETPEIAHITEQPLNAKALETPCLNNARRGSTNHENDLPQPNDWNWNKNLQESSALPIKDPTPQNQMEVGQPDPHTDDHLEAIRDIQIFDTGRNGYKGNLNSS